MPYADSILLTMSKVKEGVKPAKAHGMSRSVSQVYEKKEVPMGPSFILQSLEPNLSITLPLPQNGYWLTLTKIFSKDVVAGDRIQTLTVIAVSGKRYNVTCHLNHTKPPHILKACLGKEGITELYLYGLVMLHESEEMLLDAKMTLAESGLVKDWKPMSFITLYIQFLIHIQPSFYLEEKTREMLYVELRRRLMEGTLASPPLGLHASLHLVSFALQAEFGNHSCSWVSMRKKKYLTYFLPEHYLPSHLVPTVVAEEKLLCGKMEELHRCMDGLSRAEARDGFLEEVSHLPSYGKRLFKVLNRGKAEKENREVLELWLGVDGISLKRPCHYPPILDLPWEDVQKVSFHGNTVAFSHGSAARVPLPQKWVRKKSQNVKLRPVHLRLGNPFFPFPNMFTPDHMDSAAAKVYQMQNSHLQDSAMKVSMRKKKYLTYFLPEHYLPSHLVPTVVAEEKLLCGKMEELHRCMDGLSRAEARDGFLEEVSHLPSYGKRLFKVLNRGKAEKENREVLELWLGVDGISLKRPCHYPPILDLPWEDVQKVSFHGNTVAFSHGSAARVPLPQKWVRKKSQNVKLRPVHLRAKDLFLWMSVFSRWHGNLESGIFETRHPACSTDDSGFAMSRENDANRDLEQQKREGQPRRSQSVDSLPNPIRRLWLARGPSFPRHEASLNNSFSNNCINNSDLPGARLMEVMSQCEGKGWDAALQETVSTSLMEKLTACSIGVGPTRKIHAVRQLAFVFGVILNVLGPRLVRESRSEQWGLIVREGNDGCIYVHALPYVGIAAQSGRIFQGDRIVVVNGESLEGKTFDAVLTILEKVDLIMDLIISSTQ
ncbi:unnamed protein product [Darwinula stevensoni]|uniref:PDZ domain-containing protein n=1 Tax=Darwinula stevensoni TaxID=69355 RepID=A0A7R9A579_9CRUS|nr:unnamed protein product [Darwinula stevensoni]CAG0891518.1 unnamed protein product [Darwinula stevensoni]